MYTLPLARRPLFIVISAGLLLLFTAAGVGAQTASCPCSIWTAAATPTNPAVSDPTASQFGVEVGVKFRSSVAGYITGIRYYKSAQNTGTHPGHLWTSSGTLLGSATFTGET